LKIFSVILSFSALFIITATSLSAGEMNLGAAGYVKNFFILTDEEQDTTPEMLSRLRLRLDLSLSESISLEFAYELLPRLQEHSMSQTSMSLPTPALLAYRAFDLDERIYPQDKDSDSDFVLAQNLDRVYVSMSSSAYDLYVGRQPIAFGSARAINPTDIIAPFTYNTIAKEELVGVDAIRMKKPLADLGELDTGLIFGEDFEPDKSAAFVRIKTYQMQTDIAFMTMVFRENILLAFDLARSLGGAGTWFEAAQTLANITSNYTPEENYFRLSAGADYSFATILYTYIEYHYSGAGIRNPDNYFDAISETAFSDGAVYLLGRHYLAPGCTYEITPLLVFSARALVNLEDGSILASPALEYNVEENIYWQLGGFIGLGKKFSDITMPESEFGIYPDIYYSAFNLYF
jgi:hypothetical protein